MNLTFEEKVELVFNSYLESQDLEIAFLKNGISEEDQEEILCNKDFKQRIKIYDCMIQEELIQDLRHLAKFASTESVKFSAIKELGKIFYKKKFEDKYSKDNTIDDGKIPDKIILKGES
jgi:hypothetical protein